jgi:hypothetical protein
MQSRFQLPRHPFGTLVGHFVRRLLAGEEETEGGISLGLGAVLAILASPGAFATIFLLDKYSTLMQWFRHQNFNPYKASVADEYFFIVLSMTVTGLVMVLRWNRLFPDRRDFANLAVLPIPIRNVFLANFFALLSLGFLFALDVNAFSAIFFPFIVTISDGQGGSFTMWLVLIRSHAAAVLLSSLFSFFSVFAIVGLLMLLLPKRLFASVSLALRVLVVVALLTEFFGNMLLQLFSGHLSGATTHYASLLPSFWFLGIYESSAGLASATMRALAQRAVVASVAAVCISLAAYALCYRQRFVRLAESLDSIGGPRRRGGVLVANWVADALFPSRFERACANFIWAVLTRSERHLMFLGAYLGVGFVLTAQGAIDSLSRHSSSAVPASGVLAIPLMIAFFIATGLRLSFDIPAALSANWIFRSILEDLSPVAMTPRATPRRMKFWRLAASVGDRILESGPRRPVRTIMLLSVLSWQAAVLFPVSARLFGWRLALLEVLSTMLFSSTLVELLLLRFSKIPYTCANRADIRILLMRMLGAVLSVLIVLPLLASAERSMLVSPARFATALLLVGILWYWIVRQRRSAASFGERLTFEDGPLPDFNLLKLT